MKFDRDDLYLISPNVTRKCKRCGCRKPMRGNMYVIIGERKAAMDGSWSYRMIWLCHNGHAKGSIWTKPLAHEEPSL